MWSSGVRVMASGSRAGAQARGIEAGADLVPHLEDLRNRRGRDDGRLLAADPGHADRADEVANPRLREADLAEAPLEARPLRGGADQAHIREAAPERRRREGEVE